MTDTPRERRTIALLAPIIMLAALFLLPIVLGGRPYVDDLGRAIYGVPNWHMVGRPLADLGMIIVNLNGALADLSPLSQIAAMALLCFGAWRLVRVIDDRVLSPLLVGTAASLFALNPFLIENLAFRFDGLFMAAAAAVAVLAGQVHPGRRLLAIAVTSGLTFVTLCLYQPALNIMPIAALLSLGASMAAEPAKRHLGVFSDKVVGLIVGLATYVLVVPPLIAAGSYGDAHRAPVEFSLSGLSAVIAKLGSSLEYLWNSFNAGQLAIVIALALLGMTGALIAAVRLYPRYRSATGLVTALLIGATPLLALVASYGINAVLDANVQSPRVFMGFSMFLVANAYFALQLLVTLARTSRAAMLRAGQIAVGIVFGGIALISLTVSATFGNMEDAQERVDQFVAQEVLMAWRELKWPEPSDIVIDGEGPTNIVAQEQMSRYPLVEKLARNNLDDLWYWGPIQFQYYGLRVRQPTPEAWKEATELARKLPPDFSSPMFTLTETSAGRVLRFNPDYPVSAW